MPAAWNHCGDLGVERGRARDEEAHPAPEAVADLAEDQPVEQAVLHLERQRHATCRRRLSSSTLAPTANAWLKIFSFSPPSEACIVTMRA